MSGKRLLVLLPGFNGAARQPILLHVATAAGDRFRAEFPGVPRGRPSPGFERELAHLTDSLPPRAVPSLVGRSFGGRVALRHALTHRVRALVLLGFPVRPPGRPRPDDEAALLAVRVPTLIVQGDADEKGPLEVLRPLVAKNRALQLEVIEGAGHSFGRHESRAVELAAEFLRRR
jgi:pimeloyl-ACP methyl ester carboxylesterase